MRTRALAFAAVALACLLASPASAQVTSRYQPPSTAAEGSRVVCNTSCLSTGFQVNTTSVAGWIMVFDATSAPADGAVTPIRLYQAAINTTVNVSFTNPLRFVTGMTIVCSSTGPFTKTVTNTCTFSGDIQ